MPEIHTIRAGECVETIAAERGFFPDTVWQHPDNSALRDRRKSMNLLAEGDLVTVPDLRPAARDAGAEKRHRYRRRGVPSNFRVRFLDEVGDAIANAPFRTVIDGTFGPEGVTDAEGWVDIPVSPTAVRLRILLETEHVWAQETEFELSDLEPADTVRGAQARLQSLGFFAGGVTGEKSEELEKAVRAFESEHEIDVTGDPDADSFRSKLVEVYGC